MDGYAGKILRVDLTRRKTSMINTRDYAKWVGGHGIGSALFWDLVKDKAIRGFDPRNVVTIMTSPLTGTLAPAASARTEVQGIGVQSYPVEWFTRSNLGGRFGPMLKYAGWDGVVIEGKADKPVWVDIRNSDVQIKDAGRLWGLDTWKTQEAIWGEVVRGGGYRNWAELDSTGDGGRTTQRPAVLTIGPAGENLSRIGALIHDAGNAAGQGGFGGVWGSKNLKAISVIGSGSVNIANPDALMNARIWAKRHYAMDPDSLETALRIPAPEGFETPSIPMVFWQRPERHRPQACVGCHSGCRARHDTGYGNESCCAETAFYSGFDLKRHSGIMLRALSAVLKLFGKKAASEFIYVMKGKQTSAGYIATDLLQRYGINAFELMVGLPYIRDLNKMGLLGPGKPIDCDLPFDRLGELEFAEKLLRMIAYREGIGDDMAEGFFRAAKRWGRLEEDTGTGILEYPHWGLPNHYDPRAEIEWGYGSILGDRDINEHDFNLLFWMPSSLLWQGKEPPISAKEVTRIYAEKLVPYEGDSSMLDFSTENMYSQHMVKLIAWHRYYTRFWKQSVLYCDLRFSDFLNLNRANKRGITDEGEPKFFNAVTGNNFSFLDGIKLGRRIWNLDNAIWALQGRHRDMVHFADYIYKVPFGGFGGFATYYMPGRKNGKWEYLPLDGRTIDKAKFEDWKTKYYQFEGWDTSTGWPTRGTMESLDLRSVAEELEKKGKLGRG